MGAVATAEDPERGPVAGCMTPVIVVSEPATWREYLGTVTRLSASRPSGPTTGLDRRAAYRRCTRLRLGAAAEIGAAMDEPRRGLTTRA
jgi:hypothetical protein